MSTTTDTSGDTQQKYAQNDSSVKSLTDELEKAGLQSDAEDTQVFEQTEPADTRPRIIYSREQLVRLSKSPLVKIPDGMPVFKSWFGDWSEQSIPSTKKESDATNNNGTTRERRYRRETDDGDGSARPPFRSTLSQPSQMGNFKHQPLRASDRDRDRDIGDMRSLSDKFDRDRGRNIGLPTHSTLLRNRDRESAPHLASDRDAQRPLARKRNGESKEDWRRGAEPPRVSRDEQHSRRERDDRERQRSRVRDSSRQRDSPPSTRRDRDDHRKDRDRDRFNDADEDTRRWRDDGKREERLTSRRDKDRLDREKDKGRDRSRDAEDRDGWTLAEEKKRGGRERRYDDGRDREDRREREKEKEPAWMETYVPPPSSGGILGGKGGEGEVDSIQAWKKDMKEREMKAKGLSADASNDSKHETSGDHKSAKDTIAAPEGQLDEIQLFKLMMKQEEQKKRVANGESTVKVEGRLTPLDTGLQSSDNGLPHLLRESRACSTSGVNGIDSPVTANSESGVAGSIDPLLASKSSTSLKTISKTTSPSATSALTNSTNNKLPLTGARVDTNGSRLLSLKATEPTSLHIDAAKEATSPVVAFDPPRQSRLLAFGAQNAKVTAQPTPQSAAAAAQMGRLQQIDPLWPNQRRTSASPIIPLSAGMEKINIQQQLLASGQFDMNAGDNIPRRTGLESAGHSPLVFENGSRTGLTLDANRDFSNVDLPRSSVPLSSASERAAFISQNDAMHHLTEMRRNPTPPTSSYGVTSPISPFDAQVAGGQTTYSTGKGSRMAKHFERQREQSINVGRNVHNPGMGTNGMLSGRQDQQSFNNPLAAGENRNIQDLLTMLNNSAQSQRGHQVHGLNQNLGHHQPQSLHLGPSNALGRHDPLLDPDEGRFAPDGLVPGLRPAPAPARNREMNNGNLYGSQIEESLAFNTRLGPQQRGGLEQLFPGNIPSQFNGQGPAGTRGGLGFQQQAMRGGPSPINNFNPIHGPPQQRLPPGLANLGGRPPHEPSQFLGGGAGNFGGVPSLPAGLQHANNPQAFNQFQNPNMSMVANQGHLRGQPGLGQLGGALGNGLNGMDFRGGPGGPPQNQMLGLGGPNIGQGMRGGPAFNTQQMHGPNQLHPSINLRQQQNLQPQMLLQQVPQQIQGLGPAQHNPSELMALLMGGAHRE